MEVTILIICSGFSTPTEVYSYLFESGFEPSDCRVKRRPDGKWRGSGFRRVKPKRDECQGPST